MAMETIYLMSVATHLRELELSLPIEVEVCVCVCVCVSCLFVQSVHQGLARMCLLATHRPKSFGNECNRWGGFDGTWNDDQPMREQIHDTEEDCEVDSRGKWIHSYGKSHVTCNFSFFFFWI